MITIPIEIEVSTSVLGDIAITAAEGGIGHWSQIDTYKPSRWDNDEVESDFIFYVIAPINDDETGYEWDKAQNVTPEFLARGIGLYARAFPLPASLDEVDAEAADLIVQYAFFGEQVYG